MQQWMIYGANGYTGMLVAREAKKQGLTPILAGRNRGAVEQLATELGFEHRIFDLRNSAATRAGLEGVSAVTVIIWISQVRSTCLSLPRPDTRTLWLLA